MPSDPLRQEVLGVVAEGTKRGVAIRLVGGLAVAHSCPGATALPGLRREYFDIDLVAHRREVRQVRAVMEDLGYAGDRRFLDFTMCHEFDFTSRLEIDGETLSLADLLLTKLQVVEATDNREYLAGLCASDWELYTLVSDRIGQLAERLATYELEPAQSATVTERLGELDRALEAPAKTRRWKIRPRPDGASGGTHCRKKRSANRER